MTPTFKQKKKLYNYTTRREMQDSAVIALLVLKDYVWKPNSFARDTNDSNVIIFRFVPGKTMISPLL